MAAIGSSFVFGKKGAQRAAKGTSPRLFSLHPRRYRFRSSSLRGSFLLRTLIHILWVVRVSVFLPLFLAAIWHLMRGWSLLLLRYPATVKSG
jgi:hypothetical protein